MSLTERLSQWLALQQGSGERAGLACERSSHAKGWPVNNCCKRFALLPGTARKNSCKTLKNNGLHFFARGLQIALADPTQ
jgi:hypothetical protein